MGGCAAPTPPTEPRRADAQHPILRQSRGIPVVTEWNQASPNRVALTGALLPGISRRWCSTLDRSDVYQMRPQQ